MRRRGWRTLATTPRVPSRWPCSSARISLGRAAAGSGAIAPGPGPSQAGTKAGLPATVRVWPRMPGCPASAWFIFACAQRVTSSTVMAPLPSRSRASPSRQSRQATVANPPWALLSKLSSSGALAATCTTFCGKACRCCSAPARLRGRKLLAWAQRSLLPARVNLGTRVSAPPLSERVRSGRPETPPEKHAS